ncbi:MAG: DNA methylase N-4/N-6 [Acidobacteria bacterium]|nr:DNA methylase N-4/N-6 [Acidobacteriota bacterium]
MDNRASTRAAQDRPPHFDPLQALYVKALPSTRSGALYGAFPYPTKISPEAIALFIAAHTSPGDTVFDGFAGSGTTGLAALLCENPTPKLRQQAKHIGLNVRWGARNALLYELGALGAFVSRTLTNPPDPCAFRKAAQEILQLAESEDAWMYAAQDLGGRNGVIRYLIWSDLLSCPECQTEVAMWDTSVSRAPAEIKSHFGCPSCSYKAPLDDVPRLTKLLHDDLTGRKTRSRVRTPAWLHGTTGSSKWSRPVHRHDLDLLKRIAREPIPDNVPCVEVPWGDLYRRGYHQGITHLHHFYTRRNLIVFARLWRRTERFTPQLRDALRFWLLGYNASHATIMTRVVAKSGQKDLVLTSAQPGVLYVSGLPVEKNLIAGLRRKLSTIVQAFETIHGRTGRVEVHQRSSCKVLAADHSVDYVFTDPPFGGNIPYAEISFLNEAWLNRYTDRGDEVIISNHQKKTLSHYQELLRAALSEVRRILKPNSKATLVFHSASAEVWNALQAAYSDAGFEVERAGVLDKTQGSFKQVTTNGAVRGDPVILLTKKATTARKTVECVWTIAHKLAQDAASTLDPVEQTAQRLYSRLVTHYLANHQQIPLDAEAFYRWHAQQPSLENTARATR